MKDIFEELLAQTPDSLIPRFNLVKLRAYFNKLSKYGPEDFGMGIVYSYLLVAIIDHITNILSVFCEVTFPILINQSLMIINNIFSTKNI